MGLETGSPDTGPRSRGEPSGLEESRTNEPLTPLAKQQHINKRKEKRS